VMINLRDVLLLRTLLKDSVTALKASDAMNSSGASSLPPLESLRDAQPPRTPQRSSVTALKASDAMSSSGASQPALLMNPRDATLPPRSVRTSATAQTDSDVTSLNGALELEKTPMNPYLLEDAELTLTARWDSNAMSSTSVSQDLAPSRDANLTPNAVLNTTVTNSTFALLVLLSNPTDANSTLTVRVTTTAMSSTSASQALLPLSKEASAKEAKEESALKERDATNSDTASTPQLFPMENAPPTQTAVQTLTAMNSTSASQAPPLLEENAKAARVALALPSKDAMNSVIALTLLRPSNQSSQR